MVAGTGAGAPSRGCCAYERDEPGGDRRGDAGQSLQPAGGRQPLERFRQRGVADLHRADELPADHGGRHQPQGPAAQRRHRAADPAGEDRAHPLLPVRADPARAAAPGRHGPAGAAGAQDAGVRGLHPHAGDVRPAHASPAPRARQLLLRPGHRRAGAQPHRRPVPARHVVADHRRHARGAAALRAAGVPALSRRDHHVGASADPARRHRAAGVHRRVPVAAGDVVLPRLPAHQPASSPEPAAHRRAAGRGGRLLAVRRHHPRRGHRPARRTAGGLRAERTAGVRLRRAGLRGHRRGLAARPVSSATSTSPTPTSWSTRT